MNNFLNLVKVQLTDISLLKEILISRKKSPVKFLLLLMSLTILGLMFVSYSTTMSLFLVRQGLLDLVIPYAMCMVSLVCFAMTFMNSSDLLFKFKDFDLLMSLPIKKSALIASKFTIIYFSNLTMAFLIYLPSINVWLRYVERDILRAIMTVFALFLIPIMPMLISIIINLILSIVTARFKYKKILSTFASLVFVIFVLILLRNTNKIGDMKSVLESTISKILFVLPLTDNLAVAIINNRLALFLGTTLIYCLIVIIFIKFLDRYYFRIKVIMDYSIKSKLNLSKDLKEGSKLISLIKKEFEVFKNSPTYMLNTLVGVFILLIFSIASLVLGFDTINSWLNLESLGLNSSTYMAFIISAMISLTCTTASSISLEGKNIWLLKCLPISKKEIFDSKILLNLLLHFPVLILANITMAYNLKLSFKLLMLNLLFSSLYSIYTALLGLAMNIKFPIFDWSNETMVIKRSAANMSSAIINMISLIIIIIIVKTSTINLFIVSLVLIFINIILYIKIIKSKNIFL